jgi:glycosyltransferase involved in cell wall biosynthesis
MYGLAEIIVRTGWLPYGDVGKALSPCHIGLIALQETPNNIVTSSNKVFNYMLYGIPFIGPQFRLAKRKLVEDIQCGVLADSHSPESYAEAICHMIQDRAGTLKMSQRALNASRTKYRWEHMEPILLELYERVLSSKAK